MSTSSRALFGLLALGCGYSWQAELRRHAAVQHGCPEDEIEIVADDGNALARRVRVDVCGDGRLYEHRNTGPTYEWCDITAGDEDAAPYVVRP